MLESVLEQLREYLRQTRVTNDELQRVRALVAQYAAQLRPTSQTVTSKHLEQAQEQLREAVTHIQSAAAALSEAAASGAVVYRLLTGVDEPPKPTR